METLAYSSFPRNSGMAGRKRPIRIPPIMQRMTQTVRYFSKKPIPVSVGWLSFIFGSYLFINNIHFLYRSSNRLIR